MIRHGLLATVFVIGTVSTVSLATAQDAPPPPPPGAAMAPAAPDGAPPPPPGTMPPPPGKGPGPKKHRGPPPPPPLTKGVDIRIGRDMGIRIECGDEPIKACLDAARSLTDKIPNLVPPPPPRPGDRPEPPAPGDMNPPPTAN